MDLNKRFPTYRKFLFVYPAAYRRHYQEQMLQTLADMLDDAPSRQQKLAIWARTVLDLPVSAIRQQLSYTGAAMTEPTPKYVKNSALIGAVMLAPFFLILVAASLDRNLRNGPMWHFHVLFTFFVFLPTLAFLLATVALLSWLVERHQTAHTSWLHELLDLRRNWYLFAVLIIGLGIVGTVYGHDSVHCVTGNPIREARNASQTWRCIEQR